MAQVVHGIEHDEAAHRISLRALTSAVDDQPVLQAVPWELLC